MSRGEQLIYVLIGLLLGVCAFLHIRGGEASLPGIPNASSLYPSYQKFYPRDNATQYFLGGGQVSISTDGLYAIASLACGYQPSNGCNYGAYVYLKNPATNKWAFAEQLVPPDSAVPSGYFTGSGVVISNRGKVAAFGDFFTAMYIFEREGATSAWAFVGYNVTICDNSYAYYASIAEEGSAIATSGNDTNVCYLTIIIKNAANGLWESHIIPTSPESPVPQSGLTYWTAFAQQDSKVFARGDASISIYSRSRATGLYSFDTAFTTPGSGHVFSVSVDGARIVTQGDFMDDYGLAYFSWNGTSYAYLSKIATPSFVSSGSGKLKLFQNGLRLVVGDRNYVNNHTGVVGGAVYFYQLQGSSWNLTNVLANPDPQNFKVFPNASDSPGDSHFGYNLDISEDGTTLFVSAYTDLDGLGSVFFFAGATCTPSNGLNQEQCAQRIKHCHGQGIVMKWAGMGCRIKGIVMKDGGCQCDGYCGYTCPKACNKDRQCVWNKGTSQCLVKSNLTPGHPISTCS